MGDGQTRPSHVERLALKTPAVQKPVHHPTTFSVLEGGVLFVVIVVLFYFGIILFYSDAFFYALAVMSHLEA